MVTKRIIAMLMLIFMISSCCVFAITIEEDVRPTGGWIYNVEETENLQAFDNTEGSGGFSLNLLTAEEEETTLVPASEYYGYNALKAEDDKNRNTRLTSAYLHLTQGLKSRAECIGFTDYSLTTSEFDKVYRACNNDAPQIFYLLYGYSRNTNNGYITNVCPNYIEYLNTNDNGEEFEKCADEIIAASGVRAEMSDYDKAIMLHDELAVRVVYNEDAAAAYVSAGEIEDEDKRNAEFDRLNNKYGHIHSAYGALVLGSAVCDGYSKAYQYLLYKVGIPSHLVTGTANGGGHAWNLVCLDGKWYYTDLTWDDKDKDEYGYEHIFYSYFNITEEQSIASSHITDIPYSMPECTSAENNYFVKNNKTADAIDADFMARQLKDGLYARVYITGNIDDAKSWILCDEDKDDFPDNIASIAQKAGITDGYSVELLAKGNEISAKFIYDKLEVFKNMSVEIGSITDKQIKIIQAFYDENGVLLKIKRTDDITVNRFDTTKVKINYSSELDDFKQVKYFVWDSENNIKPLYNMVVAEY